MGASFVLRLVERIDHLLDIDALPGGRDQLLELRDEAASLREQLRDAYLQIARLEHEVRCTALDIQEITRRLADTRQENFGLRQEIGSSQSEIVRLRLALFNAERGIIDRSGEMSENGQSAAAKATAAFGDLKKAFAKRFHPNSSSLSDAETTRRSEIFKEFWGVIKSVEERHFSH